MKKRSLLFLTSILLVVTMIAGCSSEDTATLYRDIMSIGNESNSDKEYEEDNNIVVDGKFIYECVAQHYYKSVDYYIEFPDYAETNFPDEIILEPCNTKIRQGVYANYSALLPTIKYYYLDAFNEKTAGNLMLLTILCEYKDGEVRVLDIWS